MSVPLSIAIPGTQPGTTGHLANSSALPAAKGPLGEKFAALLSLVTGNNSGTRGGNPTVQPADLAAVGEAIGSIISAQNPLLEGLAGLLAGTPGPAPDAAGGTDPAGISASANFMSALAGLTEALDALDQALVDGTPLDDRTLAGATTAIDALNTFLQTPQMQNGIQLAGTLLRAIPGAEPVLDTSQLIARAAAGLTELATANAAGDDTGIDLARALAGLLKTAASPGASDAQNTSPLARITARLETLSRAVAEPAPELAAKIQTLLANLQKQGAASTPAPSPGQTTTPASELARALPTSITALMASTAAARNDGSTGTRRPAEFTPLGTNPSGNSTAPRLPQPAIFGATGNAAADPGGTSPASAQNPALVAIAEKSVRPDTAVDLPAMTADPGARAAEALARPVQAAYQAQSPALNLPGLAFEISRQAQAGNSRFQIRLDPPELGRIDVKLDLDKSGNVTARLTVERAETLELLQRDVRALERALAQAGLDSGRTSLQFALRQNPFAGSGRDKGDADTPFSADTGIAPDTDPATNAADIQNYRGTAGPGGVNLWA